MKAILKAGKNCIFCDHKFFYPFITLLWLLCLLSVPERWRPLSKCLRTEDKTSTPWDRYQHPTSPPPSPFFPNHPFSYRLALYSLLSWLTVEFISTLVRRLKALKTMWCPKLIAYFSSAQLMHASCSQSLLQTYSWLKLLNMWCRLMHFKMHCTCLYYFTNGVKYHCSWCVYLRMWFLPSKSNIKYQTLHIN